MKQVTKFYLASFLKNQIYFVPIIVLFFQDLSLNYTQIFWVFTIGSAFAFLIEIPTGLIADTYGNRRSIIISKFLIFISFIFFGSAQGFVGIMLANLVYELGKSFRSGTETAYVYNYLNFDKEAPRYTKVKINQKFYARISESLAALLGGFVAYRLGFSAVFFLAAIPALINFIQTLTWTKLPSEEKREGPSLSFKKQISFIKDAFSSLRQNKMARRVILNISVFSTAFVALDKFIQPYMKMSGLNLQDFGTVYAVFLIIVAFVVKFAARLEEKWGGVKIMNYTTYLAFVPLVFLALGANSVFMIALFFLVLIIDNFRSPVANTLFHDNISSDKRATMGSILELFKSVNNLWFLPFIGYLADIYSIKIAILIIAIFLLLGGTFFLLKEEKTQVVADLN